MENCLVTKLKGSVDNNNLQTFNTIYLDYTAQDEGQQIVIGAGSEDVIVTFAGPMYSSITGGTQIAIANTPITISSGTRISFFTSSEQTSVEKFVKVENIYHLESLVSGKMGFSYNQTTKSGLLSLAYDNNLVQFGGMMDDISIFNCKKLRLNTDDGNEEYTVGGNEVQYILGYPVEIGWLLGAPDSVHKISMKWKGDVANFPANLRYYKASTGSTFGELSDFVTKARIAGRTTGYLVLRWINDGLYDVNITLNGVSLKNNPAVTPVSINNANCAVLQWDASSISFGTSKPADFSRYEEADGDYGWQPYE